MSGRGGRFGRGGRQFRRVAVNIDEYCVYPKDYSEKLAVAGVLTDEEKDLVDFHRDLVNFYVNPAETSNYRVTLRPNEYKEGRLRAHLLGTLGPDAFPPELLAKKIAGVRPLVSLRKQALKQSLKSLEDAEGRGAGEDGDEEGGEEDLEISDEEFSNADYEITGDFEDGGGEDFDGAGGDFDVGLEMVRHRKNEFAAKDLAMAETRVEEYQRRLAGSLERLNFYSTASRSFSSFIAKQNERMSTTIRTQGSKLAMDVCIADSKRKRTALITDLIAQWSDPTLVAQRSARLSVYVNSMRQTESPAQSSARKPVAVDALNLPSFNDLAHSAKVENSHLDPVLSACPLGYGGGKAETDESRTHEQSACGTSSGLSKERKESPIPTKDGGRWSYPSPHQFYAATKAKGHEVQETQVPVIVDIHNAVNDEAWNRILHWERKFHNTCNDVRLVRFVGRPGDRSPKSLAMQYIRGWQEPFDRHDWLIDRCGETTVRYIVDFYDGKPVPTRPDLVPVFIDARPALDSVGNWIDRLRMLFSV